jgi:hypothetical protein
MAGMTMTIARNMIQVELPRNIQIGRIARDIKLVGKEATVDRT